MTKERFVALIDEFIEGTLINKQNNADMALRYDGAGQMLSKLRDRVLKEEDLGGRDSIPPQGEAKPARKARKVPSKR